MTKLPKVPREEGDVGVREQPEDQRRPELYPESDLYIPILPERIQAKIQHKDNEVEVAEEVMLEIPPEWNAVPDLIMADEEGMMITETNT